MASMQIITPLLTDGYKLHHADQYNPLTERIQINCTPRKSRIKGIDKVVHIGTQRVIQEIVDLWDENFFSLDKSQVIGELRSWLQLYTGKPYDTSKFEALYDIGYLPIHVKALPEAELVPIGVPFVKIENTIKEFFWVPNFLETLLSCLSWSTITSATIALEYRKIFEEAMEKTGGPKEFVPYMGHDFSMRGMIGTEGALISAIGHALIFDGTDTVPVLPAISHYYDGTSFPTSIPATEHSVMCTNTGFYIAENNGDWKLIGKAEKQVFIDLLKVYQEGPLSIVSDTWDLWKVLTKYIKDPEVKELILSRNGTVVFRPDSGDPVDIICGHFTVDGRPISELENGYLPDQKGAYELLWDVFGGTTTDKGYKLLNDKVGLIYGDAITIDRAKDITSRLIRKKFVPRMVFGIGSFTYQYNTRDTFGLGHASPLV
jgi:nicotinamide phosphoribosyltransferase